MALLAFPSRYRSQFGRQPVVSPGVLSPELNEDDAFNPNALESSAQSPNPVSPEPDDIRPLSLDDTSQQRQIDNQRVDLPTEKTGYRGLRALAKEDKSARMPPPGGSTNAEVGASNVALPPLNGSPTVIPGALGAAEAFRDHPEAVQPESQAIPQGAFAASPATSANTQTLPAGALVPGATSPAAAKPEAQSAADKLAALKRPDAAPNNWAQRLGLAVLSMTKFGPIANQLIHPKWASQNAAYLAEQADLEKRQKEEDTAASTAANIEAKEATAEQKRGLAADYADKRENQRLTIEDRLKAQTSERNRKFIADRLKGREADATYQQSFEPRPPGYEAIPDPERPGFVFVVPPAWRPAPAALLPFLPGAKEGDPISHSEFQNATKALTEIQKEGAKGQNKAEGPKLAFQSTLSKLAAAGELPAQANTDITALHHAIQGSTHLDPDEKSAALGYLATNPTPASTTTAGVQRMQVSVGGREQQVINKETGELEFRNPEEINRNPGLYAPAGAGSRAMSKNAIFQDLHYNIGTARKAIQGLGTMDATTRAQLALALGDTDPHSALQTWLRGEVAQAMTPQQQEAVQAIAQLSENAMAIRSLAGMGQGAMDMRDAIRHTIPSGKSPSTQYMQEQLNKFEQVVSRLEKGVPGMNAPQGKTDLSKSKFTVVAPDGSTHPFDTKAQADEFQRQINALQHK